MSDEPDSGVFFYPRVGVPQMTRRCANARHLADGCPAGQENLPILLAALTKCTFWSEDISNALLEVIIFFSVGN